MKTTAGVAMIVAVACYVAACSASATSPIEGEWRIAEMTDTNANPSNTTDPPSMVILGKKNYTMIYGIGAQPRAAFKAVTPTPEEKMAAFDSFVANAGTYELAGSMLTIRPVISKHPNFMGGGFDKFAVRPD